MDVVISSADRAGGEGRVKLDDSTKENRRKQFKADFLRDQDRRERLNEMRRDYKTPNQRSV